MSAAAVTLAPRLAACGGCSRTAPSSPELGFFTPRGVGSPSADYCAHCGWTEAAHANLPKFNKCPGYEPRGPETVDSYECGCRIGD